MNSNILFLTMSLELASAFVISTVIAILDPAQATKARKDDGSKALTIPNLGNPPFQICKSCSSTNGINTHSGILNPPFQTMI